MWSEEFEQWLVGRGLDPFSISLEESNYYYNQYLTNTNAIRIAQN